MNRRERWVMHQLLTQWAHPEFSSIKGFHRNLEASPHQRGTIEVGDWTRATLPSWIDSVVEGLRRPEQCSALVLPPCFRACAKHPPCC